MKTTSGESAAETVKRALGAAHGILVEIQKGVHGSADAEVRNSTFHSVIEIRGMIRDLIAAVDREPSGDGPLGLRSTETGGPSRKLPVRFVGGPISTDEVRVALERYYLLRDREGAVRVELAKLHAELADLHRFLTENGQPTGDPGAPRRPVDPWPND